MSLLLLLLFSFTEHDLAVFMAIEQKINLGSTMEIGFTWKWSIPKRFNEMRLFLFLFLIYCNMIKNAIVRSHSTVVTKCTPVNFFCWFHAFFSFSNWNFDSFCRLNHKPLSRNFTLYNYFAGNALQCSLRCNVNIIGCSLSKTMSAHRLASMRTCAQHKIKVENSYLYQQQQQQKQLRTKCSTKSMVVAVFFLI